VSGWQYVNRLAHHPTQTGVLFAATDTGLWKTSDGGQNWTQVWGIAPELDVKIDPNNPSVMLMGTIGRVYLSTDGGKNWADQTTWDGTVANINGKMLNNGQRCEVAFGAGGVMWVSMNNSANGQLWGSTDGGKTWSTAAATGYLAQG